MILLDTHVLVWWISDPPKLSGRAKTVIETGRESGALLVSAISAWEIALLVGKGRLDLDRPVEDWVEAVESLPFVTFLPVDPRTAVRSVVLADLHPDPADRIIVATTISRGATLITRDQKLLDYEPVDTVW